MQGVRRLPQPAIVISPARHQNLPSRISRLRPLPPWVALASDVLPTARIYRKDAPEDGAERGIGAFVICASRIRQFEFALKRMS
jgi:hypothetical protein